MRNYIMLEFCTSTLFHMVYPYGNYVLSNPIRFPGLLWGRKFKKKKIKACRYQGNTRSTAFSLPGPFAAKCPLPCPVLIAPNFL